MLTGMDALLAMPDDLPFERSAAAIPERGPEAEESDLPLGGSHLADQTLARHFLLAGNAVFTVVSKASGKRFTFRLSRPKDEQKQRDDSLFYHGPLRCSRRPIFISVLSGSDNTGSYTYLGTVWEDAEKFTYAHGRKSRVSAEAPSARAAHWLVRLLNNPALMGQCEIWHEGRCGRCGRRLTVPESISSGIGPECSKLM